MLFATAAEWLARLLEAHVGARLHEELRNLGRYPLLAVDEIGYMPFTPEPPSISSSSRSTARTGRSAGPSAAGGRAIAPRSAGTSLTAVAERG